MNKNRLRLIQCKQIIYEETFSLDQSSFNSYLTNTIHKIPIIQPHPKTLQSRKTRPPHQYDTNIIYQNLQKHNSLKPFGELFISNILTKKHSHMYFKYKEMLISINANQMKTLKRFYNLTESYLRLPKFESYYKHYLKFFAKPTLTFPVMNKLMHDYGKAKTKEYITNKYGVKNKNNVNTCNNNNEMKGTNEIFFDSNIKETIENYSTTMTCESNEHLVYPSEILLKCDKEKNLFSSESAIGNALICTTNHNNSVFHMIENLDFYDESLLTLMNDLKQRSSRSRSKPCDNNQDNHNVNINKKKNKLILTTKQNQINIVDKGKKMSCITVHPSLKKSFPKKLGLYNTSKTCSGKTKQKTHCKLFTLHQMSTKHNLYNNYTDLYKKRRLSENKYSKTNNNSSVKYTKGIYSSKSNTTLKDFFLSYGAALNSSKISNTNTPSATFNKQFNRTTKFTRKNFILKEIEKHK